MGRHGMEWELDGTGQDGMGDTNPPERHPVCVPAASAGPVPAAAENGHPEAPHSNGHCAGGHI